MNYFSSKTSAEKYIIGRPDFHANTIGRIKDLLHIDHKVEKALDIACGTGLSTKALLSIANKVHGTDISEEMLKIAIEKDKVNYTVALAEQQPFKDNEFDLITVSSGVHWFNIDSFLNEANRLLKPKGWLAIYENYFTGEMDENDRFKDWFTTVYLRRFPSPPRNKNYDWTQANTQLKNFSIRIPENFVNQVYFTREQLINYLITQSNIIAPVENGELTYAEVKQWLDNELYDFFEDETTVEVFTYGNWIKLLQKV